MADRLPLVLRLYRLASLAGSPIAPQLLARRLSRGKEHPKRLRRAPRRAELAATRRPAGVGARRQRRRNARRGAAHRAAARAGFRRAGDVRHGHLGGAGRAASAERRPAPVHSARCAAFRAAVSRPLAAGPRLVRRIRFVAQSHFIVRATQNSDDPDQRPAVGALVSPLAAGAGRDRRLARHASICA